MRGAVATASAAGGRIRFSAAGRYVDRPMISALGEGGRPEVVLPLTDAARMRHLISDPRVSGPMVAALAAGAAPLPSGSTTNVNVYNNRRDIGVADLEIAVKQARFS
jgi:hypothetical protein